MTVKEKLTTFLVMRGMSDKQAEEVMQIAIPQIGKVDDYQITFNSPSEDYPSIVYKILDSQLKPIALKWIIENKPMAFFRPLFES
jgi:hypothetical protein